MDLRKTPAQIDRILPEKRSRGRPKGSQDKITVMLKEAILAAAEGAGGKAGMIGYLQARAIDTPGPFLALLAKVLPLTVGGREGGAIHITVSRGDADVC